MAKGIERWTIDFYKYFIPKLNNPTKNKHRTPVAQKVSRLPGFWPGVLLLGTLDDYAVRVTNHRVIVPPATLTILVVL